MIKNARKLVIVSLIGIVISTLVLIGCGSPDSNPKELKSFDDSGSVAYQQDYRVVKIEDCEYLQTETRGAYFVITHKGNCKNPIHVYSKK